MYLHTWGFLAVILIPYIGTYVGIHKYVQNVFAINYLIWAEYIQVTKKNIMCIGSYKSNF
jgi:hypothetical protein